MEYDVNRNFATCPVLDVPIGVLTMNEAVDHVNRWVAQGKRTRLVTFTTVHMVVEAKVNPNFGKILDRVDLNCPDGAPIFWLVNRQFARQGTKIPGPDFMPFFCQQSVPLGHRHFFYGGGPGVAEATAAALSKRYPGIQIAGHYSPPFRSLSEPEIRSIADTINESDADVVWVCLGCPKQEQWMNDMKDLLDAKVMLAVGQAFDIVAGTTERAPRLLSKYGLEWAFRVYREPKRLWKRYLVTNALFLCLIAREKLGYTHRWNLLSWFAK